MNDHLLVEGIRRRDSGAPAAMYDAYADRLYAYCWFGLRSGDAAQVAVRDAFVAAEAHIERLRDADRFGPWLYALARLECSRRMAYHGRQPDLPIASHDQDDVDQRIMAWQAVMGLPPLSREILELRVRHQLSVPDLAAVFSLTAKEAQAALDLAQVELEAALTAELLAHEGPHGCAGRRELLRERRGELSPGLRERLLRHARECAACGAFRPRTVSAAKVYGLLPQAQPPESLRRRVMSCFYDPELVSYRLFVATRLTEFGPNGFPYQPRQPTMPRARSSRRFGGRGAPLGEGGRSFRRLAGVLAMVSVLLLSLVGGAMLLTRLTGTDGRHTGGAPQRRPTLIATPPPPRPPTLSPSPAGGDPADPGAGGPIGVPGGPMVSSTSPIGTEASAAPPSALPCPPPAKDYQSQPSPIGNPGQPGGTGTLSVAPLYLDLGDGSTGAIELRAAEGAVGWRALTGGPVRLNQSSGRLAAGETISLTVYAYREPGSEGEGTITFEPGNAQVTVSWRPVGGGPGPTLPPTTTPPPTTTSPPGTGSTGPTESGTASHSSPAGPPHDPPPSSGSPSSSQQPPPSSSDPPASSSSAPPPQESSPAEPSSGSPSSTGDPEPGGQ